MSDLADFLLARIAEDEEWARTEAEGWGGHPNDRARVLAECEAKRRIVGLEGCYACSDAWTPCEHREMTLRLLALPYADHEAYREAWRP